MSVLTDFLHGRPAWIQPVIAGVILVIALSTFGRARQHLRRAGERRAVTIADREAARISRRDSALTIASLIPAIAFWGMVLAGSFRGLVNFARTVLKFDNGWEYLVPGALDGVSITFAFLAFRAVARNKSPRRTYRVVWCAALASATVNFTYEYGVSGGNIVGAGVMALFSIFGVVMFHEFLDQFREGVEDYIPRNSPAYGWRWITWPTDTLRCFLAWHNYPPEPGTEPTVLNAKKNLERVHELKTGRRDAQSAVAHSKALQRLDRRAELKAILARESGAATARAGQPALTQASGDDELAVPPTATETSRRPDTSAVQQNAASESDRTPAPPKVPQTSDACRAWVRQWLLLVDKAPEFARGRAGITDVQAREAISASKRTAAYIRESARSGMLRDQCTNLDVELPAHYVDRPEDATIVRMAERVPAARVS